MRQEAHIPAGAGRVSAIERLARTLTALDAHRPWRVSIEPHKARRSLSQNALLWSIYDQIIDRGGEAMAGWDKDDLHTFFLIEHFGSELREIFGKRRLVPLKRSSKLSKMELSDHLEFIGRFMAEQGVFLDMPTDYRLEVA